jgi:hypothetical protein
MLTFFGRGLSLHGTCMVSRRLYLNTFRQDTVSILVHDIVRGYWRYTIMGSLFEEIQSEKSKAGNRPKIAEILDLLSDSDKKDFLKALDDHSIPASNISKAMAKRGHKLAINVISRYRRGELSTVIK